MSALPATNLPPIDSSRLPADIRTGDAKAKQAYREALGFEDMLVQRLTQQLAQTVVTPSDNSSDNGSGDSSDSSGGSSGGILGSDPSTSMFASMIPTALTQSIMSGGGVGVADSLARAIDPTIGTQAATTKGKS